MKLKRKAIQFKAKLKSMRLHGYTVKCSIVSGWSVNVKKILYILVYWMIGEKKGQEMWMYSEHGTLTEDLEPVDVKFHSLLNFTRAGYIYQWVWITVIRLSIENELSHVHVLTWFAVKKVFNTVW
jgi:hypothetical protein